MGGKVNTYELLDCRNSHLDNSKHNIVIAIQQNMGKDIREHIFALECNESKHLGLLGIPINNSLKFHQQNSLMDIFKHKLYRLHHHNKLEWQGK